MKLTPITGSPAAADVAADLRALAELVENDGDGFIAALMADLFSRNSCWPWFPASADHNDQRDQLMAETIRRFKTITATPIRKEYRDGGEGYLDVFVPLRGLTLKLVELRSEVCERVVTSTETVTEEVPDPDYIAAAPTKTVTREVEQVEWRCTPILAASDSVDA